MGYRGFEYYGEDNENEQPSAFHLNYNYPNPFNSSTIISFNLTNSGLVKLLIYNVLGELEAVLINGNMEQGIHKVQFRGESLPSGVYFYRLEAEGNAFTKKMVLLR